MIEAALPLLEKYNPEFYKRLNLEKLLFIYRRQQLRAVLKEAPKWYDKISCVWSFCLISPQFVAEFLYRRTFFPSNQSDDFIYIRKELRRLGLEEAVKVIE
jgi:hypothetical protein